MLNIRAVLLSQLLLYDVRARAGRNVCGICGVKTSFQARVVTRFKLLFETCSERFNKVYIVEDEW